MNHYHRTGVQYAWAEELVCTYSASIVLLIHKWFLLAIALSAWVSSGVSGGHINPAVLHFSSQSHVWHWLDVPDYSGFCYMAHMGIWTQYHTFNWKRFHTKENGMSICFSLPNAEVCPFLQELSMKHNLLSQGTMLLLGIEPTKWLH